MTWLTTLIATFGYTGYAPFAPGTAGSAAAVVLYVALRSFGVIRFEVPIIVLLFLLGVWSASGVSRRVGREDPGIVVIDEVVGMLITLVALPVSVTGAAAGFLLFRAFDIVKPFPAAQSEALPGGIGIMTDDVVAGIYSHLVLRGLAWMFPAWMLQA